MFVGVARFCKLKRFSDGARARMESNLSAGPNNVLFSFESRNEASFNVFFFFFLLFFPKLVSIN